MDALVRTLQRTAEKGGTELRLCYLVGRGENPEMALGLDSALLGGEWATTLLSLHDAAQILIDRLAVEPPQPGGEAIDRGDLQLGQTFGAQSLLLAALEELDTPGQRASVALVVILALSHYLPGSSPALADLLAALPEAPRAAQSAANAREAVRQIVALQRAGRPQRPPSTEPAPPAAG